MNWIGSFVLLSVLSLAGAREVPDVNIGAGCELSPNKKTCLDVDGCYWCASTTFSGQRSVCVDEVQAVQLPAWVYTCSHKVAPALEEELIVEDAKTGCDTPRSEDECLDNPACVWCSSGFGPAQEHCMSAEQAKFIPAGILTCKDKKVDPEFSLQILNKKVDPQPAAGCTNFMDRKACLKSSACHWCENKFSVGIGARCVDGTEAKFLPAMFFKCKKGKDPKPAPTPAPETAVDDNVVLNTAKPEPKPAPTPAPKCKDAKDKKACKHLDTCAWCENQFNVNGSVCLDAKAAAFIPATVFKCKASKKADVFGAPAPAPADPCKDAVDATNCTATTGCAWCENKFNATSSKCMNAAAAAFMPPTVFTCTAAKKSAASLFSTEAPAPADPCKDAVDDATCQATTGCAWCENKFNATSSKCMNAAAAGFMPPTVFKCKAAKMAALFALAVDPMPTPAPPCKAAVDDVACQAATGCVWCDNLFNATKSKCMKAAAASFLPPAVFKCNLDTNAASLTATAPTPAPVEPCKHAVNSSSCVNTTGCAWCENLFNATTSKCLNAAAAAFLPPTVFKCKAATSKAALGTTAEVAPAADPCKDAVDATTCKDTTGCAWCENKFNPALPKCMNAAAAAFIPPTVFKCKAAKKAFGAVQQVEVAPAADPCTDAVDKATCKDVAGCAWCESLFNPMGSRCMDAAKAQFIPAIVFKCKASKKAPTPADEPELTLAKVPNPCKVAVDSASCDAIDGCAWCDNLLSPVTKSKCVTATKAQFLPPAIYKCTSSALTAAALKKPAPQPTPAADPCKDAVEKKACKAIDGCAWCENLFNPTLGSLCMDATQTAFLPPTVFKCKAAKKADSIQATGPFGPTPGPTPGPQPGMMCGNTLDKKGCLNSAGCFWCTSSFGPAMTAGHCYNSMEAQFLPAYMYKCKAAKVEETSAVESVGPAPGPQPGVMCGNTLDKKGCLHNPGCFWCTSSFGPAMTAGRCYNEMEAQFLPAYMYKCKAAKQQEVFEEEEEEEDTGLFQQVVKELLAVFKSGAAPSPYAPPAPPTPGAGCTSAMDKDSCLDQKNCYWCDNKFTPGIGASCMDAAAAKFLPDAVFKCKKGGHKKDSSARKIISF